MVTKSPISTAWNDLLVNPPLKMTEAAKLLGIERRTAYRWLKQGKMQAIKLMGCWRVSRAEIVRLLKGGE